MKNLTSNLSSDIKDPKLPEINGFYGIMITGIGGTGYSFHGGPY